MQKSGLILDNRLQSSLAKRWPRVQSAPTFVRRPALKRGGPHGNEIWTTKRCLEWTKEYLAERGEEHPRLSAEWLLCAATGLARIDLYMRMDETLDAAQLETMHAAVVRRAKGEPLQYITGSTQFRMVDVACAPGVLIPRPETEMLVEEVLNYLDAEVLSPEAAARQRVELPWNDEVEQARKAEAGAGRRTRDRRAPCRQPDGRR